VPDPRALKGPLERLPPQAHKRGDVPNSLSIANLISWWKTDYTAVRVHVQFDIIIPRIGGGYLEEMSRIGTKRHLGKNLLPLLGG
jgi:hypothetical protein